MKLNEWVTASRESVWSYKGDKAGDTVTQGVIWSALKKDQERIKSQKPKEEKVFLKKRGSTKKVLKRDHLR